MRPSGLFWLSTRLRAVEPPLGSQITATVLGITPLQAGQAKAGL